MVLRIWRRCWPSCSSTPFITPAAFEALLAASAERSFNCITVDSDTSTNDTTLVFATGAAGHSPTDAAEPRVRSLRAALDKVMLDLAQQVVKDGEGISKFVTIEVRGAVDPAARRMRLRSPTRRWLRQRSQARTRKLGPHRHGGGESPESTSRPSDWRSP